MGRDYFTEDGARLIKEKIVAYWLERGLRVEVYFKHGAFAPALRTARVDVRSNMINGIPSKIPKKETQY